MNDRHIICTALDALIALAAMGFCTRIVWNYIDQKMRAERPMEGDDGPFLSALAIVCIFVLTLAAFGAIGWLAG